MYYSTDGSAWTSAGGNFLTSDVYVNVAGGLAIDEPAIDLGIIAALISSQKNMALPHDLVVFGEVGLLGEIRSVSGVGYTLTRSAPGSAPAESP